MNEELKVIISAEIEKLKSALDDGKKRLGNFIKEGTKDFDKLNDEFQKAGDVSKKALGALGTAAIGATTALLALGASTAEYREAQARLTTAFEAAGGSAENAKDTYNDLFRTLGDSDKANEAAGHLAKLTTGEKELSEWTTICQGVYATFGESLPIEGLTEAANETAKVGTVTGGLADALNWAGVSEDAFNEKLAACNDEAEREKLIRETLSGLYDDAAAKYEKNNAQVLAQNEATQKMNDAMAALGEVVAPINTMLTELGAEVLAELTPYIQEFAENHLPSIKEALSGVGEAIGKVITWIADNWELVSTLGAVILGIAAAISVVSTVMGVVNAVMAASPVTWIVLAIVAAIAALVAIIVVVIKHWDKIKAATGKAWDWIKQKTQQAVDAVVKWFNSMKEKISSIITKIKDTAVKIFTAIKDNISQKIQAAKDLVLAIFDGIKSGIQNRIQTAKNIISNIVAAIKAVFSGDFGAAKDAVLRIFDNIKDGIKKKIENAKNTVKNVINAIKGFFNFKWSLPKLKMPSIKITGKFSLSPLSVPKFSISWNALGGVFDNPAVFGFGNSLQGIGEDGAEAVVPLEKNTKWLDRIAEMLVAKMGGTTPVVLQVGERVLGEAAISSINSITKQTGNLPLILV